MTVELPDRRTMKTSDIMKRFLLIALAAICQSPFSQAAGDRVITEKDSHEIASYFNGYLSGDKSLYGVSSRLGTSAAVQAREQVWKIWKEAVERFYDEGLPPLRALRDSVPGQWTLPSSLEPDAVMPFYWGSKGEKPDHGYPMFLYLHGSGPKDREWSNGFRFGNTFEDAPSVYFIPQIPNEGEWYRWWQKSKQYAWEKLLRLALACGDIDPDRIYFFGISEGGYGSQRLASYYADYLAGAGPMAGGEPLRNAPPENCASIAFSFRTGAVDKGFYRNELTAYAGEVFDSLRTARPGFYTHEIELIPGMGHHIDYTRTTPWLYSHVRDPYPEYVCWEDFEMDGLYRDGFCNLQVLERSNQDFSFRTRYEMTIEDNTVNVNVDLVSYTVTERDPVYGIEMRYSKSLSPATSGEFIVYLNDYLIDPSKKVTVNVNGATVFEGRLRADIRNMVSSCALFGDPERIFPYAVKVSL